VNCRKIRQKLNAYVDGELPSKEREYVRTHLKECTPCAQAFGRLQKLGLTLKEVSIPKVPEDLTLKVLAQAQGRLSGSLRESFLNRLWPNWWAAEAPVMRAAAALMLIMGLAIGSALGWHINKRSKNLTSFRSAYDMGLEAYYNLDFLGGTPLGSIEQVCLTIVSHQEERR